MYNMLPFFSMMCGTLNDMDGNQIFFNELFNTVYKHINTCNLKYCQIEMLCVSLQCFCHTDLNESQSKNCFSLK